MAIMLEYQLSIRFLKGGIYLPGKQIALLRGINVGKAKRVAMEDLRILLQELGFRDVKTVLNSGNAVFTSDEEDTVKAASSIENALAARTGVSSKTMVFTETELKEIVSENSLLERMSDPSKLLVAFVQNHDELLKLSVLEGQQWGEEAFILGSRAAYLWCPEGVLKSKLPLAVGKIIGDSVTTRNWATVLKLNALIG